MSPRSPRVAPALASVTPAVAVAAVLLVAGLLSACGADDTARLVRTGEVIDGSATAYVGAHPVEFMVPSGRVTVTVSDPVSEVSSLDTADGDLLRASPGTALLGVTWTLDRGAYPDTVNFEVASPSVVLGDPRGVDLALVVQGRRFVVPDVGAMTDTGRRESTTVWLGVPAGVGGALTPNPTSTAASPSPSGSLTPTPSPTPTLSPQAVGRAGRVTAEVTYDGLLQKGDVQTGTVAPGVAAPLYDPLPTQRSGTCEVSGPPVASCLFDYAVGYPYVDGLGWAPQGSSYAVIGFQTPGTLTRVRLAGRDEAGTVSDDITTFHVYELTPTPRRLRLEGRLVRGTAVRTLRASLEGSLT